MVVEGGELISRFTFQISPLNYLFMHFNKYLRTYYVLGFVLGAKFMVVDKIK